VAVVLCGKVPVRKVGIHGVRHIALGLLGQILSMFVRMPLAWGAFNMSRKTMATAISSVRVGTTFLAACMSGDESADHLAKSIAANGVRAGATKYSKYFKYIKFDSLVEHRAS
jgi:hypothetical protein